MFAIRRGVDCAMEPNRTARLVGLVGIGAVGAGALTYVGLVDPHRPDAIFPTCPFKLLTGWNCPACGGLRMTHDVLHGDFRAAIFDNVYLLIGLPALAAWVLWQLNRGRRPFSPADLIVIAVTAIAWTVVRNLPGFPLVPTILAK